MPAIKELELNKRYSFSYLTEMLPDMWVFLTDPEYDEGNNIKEAQLVAYCSHDEEETGKIVADLRRRNINFHFCMTISKPIQEFMNFYCFDRCHREIITKALRHADELPPIDI